MLGQPEGTVKSRIRCRAPPPRVALEAQGVVGVSTSPAVGTIRTTSWPSWPSTPPRPSRARAPSSATSQRAPPAGRARGLPATLSLVASEVDVEPPPGLWASIAQRVPASAQRPPHRPAASALAPRDPGPAATPRPGVASLEAGTPAARPAGRAGPPHRRPSSPRRRPWSWCSGWRRPPLARGGERRRAAPATSLAAARTPPRTPPAPRVADARQPRGRGGRRARGRRRRRLRARRRPRRAPRRPRPTSCGRSPTATGHLARDARARRRRQPGRRGTADGDAPGFAVSEEPEGGSRPADRGHRGHRHVPA